MYYMPTSLELRELFHLMFLRHFGDRFPDRNWAVKGGICLRFFHRSQRLSEDMDLDIEPNILVGTLQKGVEHILSGRAFMSNLSSRGITRMEFSAPKQTPTTQRWKISLATGGARPLTTKLEFSRRSRRISCTKGIPSMDVLERHLYPPFTSRYYGAGAMVAQKVAAMADSGRNASRDLFDLDHLLSSLGTGREQYEMLVGKADIRSAIANASRFTWRSFKEEVLPYLEPSVIGSFQGQEGFLALQSRVISALSGEPGSR